LLTVSVRAAMSARSVSMSFWKSFSGVAMRSVLDVG
jgi:hypothetical protein